MEEDQQKQKPYFSNNSLSILINLEIITISLDIIQLIHKIIDYSFLKKQNYIHFLILYHTLHIIQDDILLNRKVLLMDIIILMKNGIFSRDNISSYHLIEFNMKGKHSLFLKQFQNLAEFFRFYKFLSVFSVLNLRN